jgi:HK97 family phage portal protein
MTPEQQQLLSTRQNSVEDLCRWLDMPPVLAYHSNMTTWGSGIEQIINGWHTLSIRPLMIFIEQAVRKSVLTAQQRQRYTCEFSYDALLRGDPDKRSQIIARQVQNGLKNRDEGRQLENDPPYDGGNIFTVQSNLVPVNLLGAVNSGKINTVNQPEIAQ